jgi:hypothetical protein
MMKTRMMETCMMQSKISKPNKYWHKATQCKKAKPSFQLRFRLLPGNVLLSQEPSLQVPSALEGLTVVFGMGTCVSPPPSSPDKPISFSRTACSCAAIDGIRTLHIRCVSTEKPSGRNATDKSLAHSIRLRRKTTLFSQN